MFRNGQSSGLKVEQTEIKQNNRAKKQLIFHFVLDLLRKSTHQYDKDCYNHWVTDDEEAVNPEFVANQSRGSHAGSCSNC